MQQPTSTQFSQQQNKPIPPPQPIIKPTSKLNASFFQRTKSTIFMLVAFVLILGAGQVYTGLLILFLNYMVFREINNLKRNEQKQFNIPLTKYINWYIFFCVNYYALGIFLINKFPALGLQYRLINFLFNYHSIITCCFAIVCLVAFVFSLKQGYLKYQFRLFAWVLLAMILVNYQSWYLIHSIFQGIFFYIVPSLLIIVNDIFAYIFGYFFGKRQLIALSPKKTWEGYIGGAVSTFFAAFILTSALSQIPGITCPMIVPDLTPFSLPNCYQPLFQTTTLGFLPFEVTKMSFHIAIIGLFASIIGPFGGFFASGLKRSIKIKDFANLIPGHGGVTDRLDCQVIIGTFTYFYVHSFIRTGSSTINYWINSMTLQQKQIFYSTLVEQFKRVNYSI